MCDPLLHLLELELLCVARDVFRISMFLAVCLHYLYPTCRFLATSACQINHSVHVPGFLQVKTTAAKEKIIPPVSDTVEAEIVAGTVDQASLERRRPPSDASDQIIGGAKQHERSRGEEVYRCDDVHGFGDEIVVDGREGGSRSAAAGLGGTSTRTKADAVAVVTAVTTEGRMDPDPPSARRISAEMTARVTALIAAAAAASAARKVADGGASASADAGADADADAGEEGEEEEEEEEEKEEEKEEEEAGGGEGQEADEGEEEQGQQILMGLQHFLLGKDDQGHQR